MYVIIKHNNLCTGVYMYVCLIAKINCLLVQRLEMYVNKIKMDLLHSCRNRILAHSLPFLRIVQVHSKTTAMTIYFLFTFAEIL
jgi:hypothetical protein